MSKLELTKSAINNFGYADVDRKNLEAIEAEIRAEERAKTIKEVLDTMHEIYSADLHCMADMCESPAAGGKCDSCMYFAIKNAVKAMSGGKDTNVTTRRGGEQE